jgi:hypothetical protein
MTSRERVIAAIEHRKPDRVPIDLGGTIMSGISVFAIPALREALGLPQRIPKAYELYQMLGEVEDDIVDAMGIDVLPVEPEAIFFDINRRDYKRWNHPNGFEMLVPGAFAVEEDRAGNLLLHSGGDPTRPVEGRMPSGGLYFDMVASQSLSLDYTPPPLAGLEAEYLAPLPQKHLEHLAATAARLRPTGKALFLGDWRSLGPPMVGNTPDWLCVLAGEHDYVESLVELKIRGDVIRLEQLADALGDTIDLIGVDGQDFGTQRAGMFSAEVFEYAYLPYYRAIIGWIREHTTWKTWKHTCGAAADFLPMFIEAGLDCINPVQISASGMEPRSLAERFGDRITFWGGGIDTQHTLPFGTPEEVYAEVSRLITVFGRNGGFVFNTVHNIQANSPAANLKAMIEAVSDAG